MKEAIYIVIGLLLLFAVVYFQDRYSKARRHLPDPKAQWDVAPPHSDGEQLTFTLVKDGEDPFYIGAVHHNSPNFESECEFMHAAAIQRATALNSVSRTLRKGH